MSIKQAAISGVKWSSIAFAVKRALAFLTNIILARILTPNDFGLVAMAALALGFVDMFRDLGTGAAIIQRKQLSASLLSSIFWINVGVGCVVSASLYALSPAIAEYYREPGVTPLMQVLALSFFVSALSIVQNSLLMREMAFERLAKIELMTAVFSSMIAISAAYSGFGVMSLVYQPLLNSVFMWAMLWYTASWRPQWLFHWGEVREVAGYSLNLTGFNVINYFARNADNLLIGRYLGAEDLGYYDLAYRLMLYPLQGISAVVAKVMFPLYSQMQDNNEQFRNTYLKAIAAIALVSFPLMLGLLAVSEPFVLVLFGEQWRPVVPLLMIFSPLGAIQSLTTTVGSIYQAKGRTDWLLRWGVGASIVTMLAFALGLQWGILGVAAAYACACVLLSAPMFKIPFRLIDLRLRGLIQVTWRTALCSVLMALVVYAAQYELANISGLIIPAWVNLMGMVVLGACAYLAFSLLINRERLLGVIAAFKG